MGAAFLALTLTYGDMYLDQYHGQAYHDTREKVQGYHIDDLATIGEVYNEQKITFKWEW